MKNLTFVATMIAAGELANPNTGRLAADRLAIQARTIIEACGDDPEAPAMLHITVIAAEAPGLPQ